MIEIDELKNLALKLHFTMNESEYKTLQDEFAVMFETMELIGKIKDIEDVEPMVFPFENEYTLRDDNLIENISKEDVLKNAKKVANNRVEVPKVVNEE